MNGRDLLLVARQVVVGVTEAHWRTAANRAYYALLLEGREALQRWGFPPPAGEKIHRFVRLLFTYAADPNLFNIGRALDHLGQLRAHADYDLQSLRFGNRREASHAISRVAIEIAKLDAIEADPALRAAAIADIRAHMPPHIP